MFKSKIVSAHLGPMGLNSPGYAPRKGTAAYTEAELWQQKYNAWLASTLGQASKSE